MLVFPAFMPANDMARFHLWRPHNRQECAKICILNTAKELLLMLLTALRYERLSTCLVGQISALELTYVARLRLLRPAQDLR